MAASGRYIHPDDPGFPVIDDLLMSFDPILATAVPNSASLQAVENELNANPQTAQAQALVKELEMEIGFNTAGMDDIKLRITNLDVELRTYMGLEAMDDVPEEKLKTVDKRAGSIFLTEISSNIKRPHKVKPRSRIHDLRQSNSTTVTNRIVSLHHFPGIPENDAPIPVPLPPGVNAADVLERVISYWNFQPIMGIQHWRELFCQKLSVDIMQDTFWYFWCALYMTAPSDQPLKQQAMNIMFSRVADTYTWLFQSVQMKHKDDFFSRFPNAMAQCVYHAFCLCFPQSVYTSFGRDFKEALVTLVYNWMTGSNPPNEIWETWPEKLRPLVKDVVQVVHEMIAESNVKELGETNVDHASAFTRDLSLYTPRPMSNTVPLGPVIPAPPPPQQLLWQAVTADQTLRNVSPQPAVPALDMSKLINPDEEGRGEDGAGGATQRSKKDSKSFRRASTARAGKASQPQQISVPPLAMTARAHALLSTFSSRHHTGAVPEVVEEIETPRSEYSQVPFNIMGNCPLIAHHFRVHGKHRDAGKEVIVQRTEYATVEGPKTYRQVAHRFDKERKVKRVELARSEEEAKYEKAQMRRILRHELATIRAAEKAMLRIENQTERRFHMKKYVNDLVVKLLPELTMTWVEEVEGTDTKFESKAVHPLLDLGKHDLAVNTL